VGRRPTSAGPAPSWPTRLRPTPLFLMVPKSRMLAAPNARCDRTGCSRAHWPGPGLLTSISRARPPHIRPGLLPLRLLLFAPRGILGDPRIERVRCPGWLIWARFPPDSRPPKDIDFSFSGRRPPFSPSWRWEAFLAALAADPGPVAAEGAFFRAPRMRPRGCLTFGSRDLRMDVCVPPSSPSSCPFAGSGDTGKVRQAPAVCLAPMGGPVRAASPNFYGPTARTSASSSPLNPFTHRQTSVIPLVAANNKTKITKGPRGP